MILDRGVKANRVPYSPGSGARTSKYIEGLIKWLKIVKGGITDKMARSIAFRIAHNAKKEGHPTRGSFAYSSNGRRTGWIKHAIDNNVKKIDQKVDFARFATILIDNTVEDILNSLKG